MRYFTIAAVALMLLVAVPIGFHGVNDVRAQFDVGSLLGGLFGGGETVKVVSDTSQTSVTSALQNTLTRVFQGISSGQLQSINLKETVLDPIAWNMAKQLQQQMTGNLLKWLGGQLPGQNGEVPFIQDYAEHFQSVIDQAVGTYLTQDQAGDSSGLCNQEESFQVRTAILNAYREDVRSAQRGTALSCTENQSGSGSDGQYDTLAAKLLSDIVGCRDRVCSTFKGTIEAYTRAQNAVENERLTSLISGGMKVNRVCGTTNNADGSTSETCKIVNPLYLASQAVSKQLVDVPADQLGQIDEFNEIVSSFMSQLTNEAVTGISSLLNGVDFTGVLGLSGNADYTNLLFGADGTLSYVDSLINDDISQYQSGGTNPIELSLATEQKYLALQTKIFNEVDALAKKTDANKAKYPGCYDLELTSDLAKAKTDAEKGIAIATTSVAILDTLNGQYKNAADASTKNAVTATYISYKNQGIFATDQENQELELTFINYTFAVMVDQFKYDMATEQQSCGGPFDYNGLAGGGSNGQGASPAGSSGGTAYDPSAAN